MALAAARPTNAIFVIMPYWRAGTWVFDDPRVGLVQEPFVSGVPEILSEMVEEIPNAKKGFRLLFSSEPFPGYQREFLHVRTEYGGTWYRSPEVEAEEGWLCPALFKYFPYAPEHIYVRAEAL